MGLRKRRESTGREGKMYYLRRFLAQGVDAVIVTLIGVVIFFFSEHSPVLRGEEQWSITFRPG